MGTRERLLNLTPNVLPRFDASDLTSILARKGYGIASSLPKRSITSSIDSTRKEHDLESNPDDASLGSKKLQVNYSGKPEVRITFYRHRLADHSRAISEKALVDSLQYAGLIGGDSQEEIRLTHVEQEKIGTDQEEKTVVEIIYPEVDFENLWRPAKKHLGR